MAQSNLSPEDLNDIAHLKLAFKANGDQVTSPEVAQEMEKNLRIPNLHKSVERGMKLIVDMVIAELLEKSETKQLITSRIKEFEAPVLMK